MKYHVHTMHGISEGVSQSNEQGSIFGIVQGATDSPTGWLLISTILSKMYDTKAHGCTLQDPIYHTLVKWSHVMFVDDTYLYHTEHMIDDTVSQLKTIVQHDIRQWYSGLHFFRGKIEPK